MNDAMVNRGPDSEGFFINENFGMGMRRLSIIDLEKSNQPIFSLDRKISIIFNGEIYNYIEIRKELSTEGVNFFTNGDTEVILKLYEKYGENFIKKINGMFSICIFDNRKEKKILLYRDRFGIKPLYYIKKNNEFIFSSSLNSFKNVIPNLKKSKESFLLYLTFNYFPGKHTVYEDVFCLEPGSLIKIENNNFKIEQYFDVAKSKLSYDFKSFSIENINYFLEDSIKINLRSDVNLGLMLSSGIDSSIIAFETAKLTKKVKSYSVDFEGKLDNEAMMAKMLSESLQMDHESIYLKEKELSELLPVIFKEIDEPCADTAIIPSYIISQKAKLDGVKVLLSGAGGDEIFAGYSRHYINFLSSFYGILSFLKFIDHSLINILPFKYQNYIFKAMDKKYSYVSNTSGQNLGILLNSLNNKEDKEFILNFIEKFLSKTIKHSFKINTPEIILSDLSFYLPDNILLPFDKVTMLNSVEGRVPLLDHRIIEYINNFKFDVRMNGNAINNKKIMRILYKKKLPKFIFENSKKGFNAPIDKWNNIFNQDFLSKSEFKDLFKTTLINKNFNNKEFSAFLYNYNSYNIWSYFH